MKLNQKVYVLETCRGEVVEYPENNSGNIATVLEMVVSDFRKRGHDNKYLDIKIYSAKHEKTFEFFNKEYYISKKKAQQACDKYNERSYTELYRRVTRLEAGLNGLKSYLKGIN